RSHLHRGREQLGWWTSAPGPMVKTGSETRNRRHRNSEARASPTAAQHSMIRAAPSDSDSDDALVTKEIHHVGFALPAGHPRDRRSAEEARAETQRRVRSLQ